MHVRACCCQSSWLKHPFVQKRGEMQCHCSDSSVTPDPLCSVPFVRLWGKRKLLCGLLVTMPCSQTTKGTSWQYQPAVLRRDFALMWGKNPISCICKNPGVPTGGKRGALSSRQQQQLLWHNVRPCWQSRVCSGCAAQGSLLMAGRRQHPAAAPNPAWLGARFSTHGRDQRAVGTLGTAWEAKRFMSQYVSVF